MAVRASGGTARLAGCRVMAGTRLRLALFVVRAKSVVNSFMSSLLFSIYLC